MNKKPQKKLTKKQIRALRDTYAQWPQAGIRAITDKGEGVIALATYEPLDCGCRVTGNGTLQFPLTVKHCFPHAEAVQVTTDLIGAMVTASHEIEDYLVHGNVSLGKVISRLLLEVARAEGDAKGIKHHSKVLARPLSRSNPAK